MLPGPIAPPPPRRPPPRPPRPPLALGLLLGLGLTLVGVAGSILWVGALSPYSFTRFPLAEGVRSLKVERAGTYVVFEEFPGASGPTLPAPLEVTVTGPDGSAVPLVDLAEPGVRRSVDGYRVPGHEGRAVARFVAPAAGDYLVVVFERLPGTYPPDQFAPRSDVTMAAGSDLATSALGRPIVGAAMGPLPAVAGLALVTGTAVRRRHR